MEVLLDMKWKDVSYRLSSPATLPDSSITTVPSLEFFLTFLSFHFSRAFMIPALIAPGTHQKNRKYAAINGGQIIK